MTMNEAQSRELIAAAKALTPQIKAVRDELETARRLPESLVRGLAQVGIFKIYYPRSLGGLEADPLTVFHVVEEISKTDGAVGWCANIAAATTLIAAYMPAEVTKSLFGTPPDVRIAGTLRPSGVARIVDGGFRVSGRFTFASGINHSNWMFCTCRVFDENGPRLTADGSPELRSAMIPSEEVRVLDTWSVVGMIATGSHDVEVDDVFVPAERTSWVEEPSEHLGPLYNSRFLMCAAWMPLAANLLGIARGAMDTFVDLAEKSATNLSDTILRERQAVQIEAAQSEAIINSARAYLLDAVGTAWMAICDGQPDPSREIAQSRLAITHACHEAVRAVDMLFHAAGTNSIYRQQRIERSFRDVHVGVQHMAAHAYNVEGAGQVLLGLTPSGLGW